MAPGETGDFCNDHYHGGSALDVELTRRVGTTLEEGTEVAVAVETSGSWRRVRASSETPWEPTSSAVCSFFSFLSLSLSLYLLFFLSSFLPHPCVVKVKRAKACSPSSIPYFRTCTQLFRSVRFFSFFSFFFLPPRDSRTPLLRRKSIHR